MKKLMLILGLFAPSFGFSQQYSVDWFEIAGGGGTSSNGQYTMSGTIGQHEAGGAMNGGNYSLTGGFWALYAVQTPGLPLLKITLNPRASTATISWPSPSTGFLLQQNGNLATTNWVNFSGSTNDDGTNKTVTITPPTSNLYFRLKR